MFEELFFGERLCSVADFYLYFCGMKKIILITGGQRSGKSSEAERMALSLSDSPVYVATAHIWDEEFRERVRKHQERRGPQWTNIEEERELSRHDVTGRVVLIDCCTLWATNYFCPTPVHFDQSQKSPKGEELITDGSGEELITVRSGEELPDVDSALKALQAEFDRFTQQDATFIFVTNEIGMGGVSANAVQRRFTDLLGWFNQYVASKADEVYLMVSGIRVNVKDSFYKQ